MKHYEITWSSRSGRQGARTVRGAALAQAWVSQFRDQGADKIVIKQDGEPVAESDLPKLIVSEADETRNAMRA